LNELKIQPKLSRHHHWDTGKRSRFRADRPLQIVARRPRRPPRAHKRNEPWKRLSTNHAAPA